jgi:hypothetical protein
VVSGVGLILQLDPPSSCWHCATAPLRLAWEAFVDARASRRAAVAVFASL